MTSIRISAAIRLAYLRALFSLPISMLDMLAPGSTAAIITITASILQLGISEKIGTFFSSLSTVIAGFTIAFAYNWLLTLTTASGLVFILFVYMFTTPPIIKRLNDVQNMDIAAASVATEAFSANRMLAACGAEFKMMAKYGFLADESRKRGAGMAWLVAFQQGLSESCTGSPSWHTQANVHSLLRYLCVSNHEINQSSGRVTDFPTGRLLCHSGTLSRCIP